MTGKAQGGLQEHNSDNIYRAIFENSIDAIFITTPDGSVLSANAAACKMFGYTEEEIVKAGRNGILDLTDERIPGLLKEREKTGKISGELRYRRKDGSVFPADFTSTVFEFEKGKEHTITIVRDISSRKLLENNLIESEKNLRALIDAVDDSLFLIEKDGDIILANSKLAENFGRNMEDIIGTNTYKLVAPDVAASRKKMADRAISEGYPVAFTDKRSDRYIENRIFPIRDHAGIVTRLAIFGRDITIQKEAEQLLSSSNELLGVINRATSKFDLIKSVTCFLRNVFGFEAVGVRLREGDDFPYYETSGFTDEFVQKESCNCSYSKAGELLRDSDGNPLLECMCGILISGLSDPSKPFFTSHGSFWSNSLSELMTTSSDDDLKSRIRNMFKDEGYESAGLFTLRFGNKIAGILQVNDHRKGIFNSSLISVLDILCDNISIALQKISVEEELRKSEDKFRMLVKLSPAGIYMTDKDGKCTFVNEAWCRMAGMDPEEAYGDGWINAIHPNDRTHVFKLWDVYVNTGKEWNWTYRFIDKKGDIRWIYGLSKPVVNLDGNVIGFLGTNTDITERRKVENALQESESRFRKMAENSLTGIYIVDGYRLKYVNPSLANIFGYTQDELTGEDPMKIIHPSDRDMVTENIRLRMSGEIESLRYEFRGLCKDGTIKHILVLGEAIELEGRRNIFGNILDITDRKLAEENLRQSEEKYRLLSEQSGVGIGLYSKDGIILFFNTRALKNLGGKMEDYAGRSLVDVFGKKDGTKYLKRVTEAIRLKKNMVFEDHFTSPTGNYWFSSSHSLFSNSNGEVIGVQVVSHDISERKFFEEQLKKSTNELRELARHLVEVRESERTNIARDLHDDLGQKLTALNMDISWLKTRIGVQSRTVENKFQQMTSLMNETIESIQKISYGLRPSILDDLGLLPALEWLIKEFNKTSGITINASFAPKELDVDSQISLIVFRIVQEALTNVTRHSKATKAFLLVNKLGKILEVSVRDNGKGIEIEKIENPKSFGLVGMRERVNLIGGELIISGKPGEGTLIQVRIPLEVIGTV